MQPHHAPSVEDLSLGLIRTYYRNGRIVVYRLSATNNDAVAHLIHCGVDLLERWPATQPYLALVEVTSNMNIDLARLKAVAADVPTTRPDLCGASAYVLNGPLPKAYVRQILDETVGLSPRPVRIFASTGDAVAWLETVAAACE